MKQKTFSITQVQEIKPDQQVAIRGFLYKNEKDEWVLSEDPQLKSCCVGNLPNQVFVVGDVNASEYPALKIVRGHFLAESGVYKLVDAQMVEPAATGLLPLSFFAIAGILYFFSKRARTN